MKTEYSSSKDSETLPVNMAKMIAFLSLLMSLGFVLAIYFFLLRPIFIDLSAIGIIFIMLVIFAISYYIAMKRIMKKICCEQCHQPFFSRLRALFFVPKQCQSCGRTLDV